MALSLVNSTYKLSREQHPAEQHPSSREENQIEFRGGWTMILNHVVAVEQFLLILEGDHFFSLFSEMFLICASSARGLWCHVGFKVIVRLVVFLLLDLNLRVV